MGADRGGDTGGLEAQDRHTKTYIEINTGKSRDMDKYILIFLIFIYESFLALLQQLRLLFLPGLC
jgi:hypothetical protein